jgi:hypothetical protein
MHDIARGFETATTDGTARPAANQDCLSLEGVVPGFRVVSSMQMGRVGMQLARFYRDSLQLPRLAGEAEQMGRLLCESLAEPGHPMPSMAAVAVSWRRSGLPSDCSAAWGAISVRA